VDEARDGQRGRPPWIHSVASHHLVASFHDRHDLTSGGRANGGFAVQARPSPPGRVPPKALSVSRHFHERRLSGPRLVRCRPEAGVCGPPNRSQKSIEAAVRVGMQPPPPLLWRARIQLISLSLRSRPPRWQRPPDSPPPTRNPPLIRLIGALPEPPGHWSPMSITTSHRAARSVAPRCGSLC
jgi:hypothetical protein